jgi:hypothetical protein
MVIRRLIEATDDGVTITIPEVADGLRRKYLQCTRCGRTYYYDYIPYGLSNPILFLHCGHSTGRRWQDATVEVDERTALELMIIHKADSSDN